MLAPLQLRNSGLGVCHCPCHLIPGRYVLKMMKINRIDHIVLTVKDIEGPIKHAGVIGAIMSFYFRDPDGNLMEVSKYETNT